MNGVLYLPVGEQMGINELEESAMSFSSRLSSQHISLAILGSVKILLEIPAKVKANHRQRWLVFIQCVFFCLLWLKKHSSWESGYLYRRIHHFEALDKG